MTLDRMLEDFETNRTVQVSVDITMKSRLIKSVFNRLHLKECTYAPDYNCMILNEDNGGIQNLVLEWLVATDMLRDLI